MFFFGLPPFLYPILTFCENSDNEAAGEEPTSSKTLLNGPSSSNVCLDSSLFSSSMTEDIESKGKEADKSEAIQAFFDDQLITKKKNELQKVIEDFVLGSKKVNPTLPSWMKK